MYINTFYYTLFFNKFSSSSRTDFSLSLNLLGQRHKMEHKETVPQPKNSDSLGTLIFWVLVVAFLIWSILHLFSIASEPQKIYVPDITISLMNFTVFNITETRFNNTEWNLSIRIPEDLPGTYICLQGDFQASLLYKNITIATSSVKRL